MVTRERGNESCLHFLVFGRWWFLKQWFPLRICWKNGFTYIWSCLYSFHFDSYKREKFNYFDWMLSGIFFKDMHVDAFSFPKDMDSWLDQKKLFGDLRIHDGRLLYKANQREIIALVFFINKIDVGLFSGFEGGRLWNIIWGAYISPGSSPPQKTRRTT